MRSDDIVLQIGFDGNCLFLSLFSVGGTAEMAPAVRSGKKGFSDYWIIFLPSFGDWGFTWFV